MSTKLNPGKWDYYAAAMPDEPFFVLLGRDIEAPRAVEHWADLRSRRLRHGVGEDVSDAEKIAEANDLAQQMRDWRALANEKWKGYTPKAETDVKAFNIANFANAILKDIVVNIFENDASVEAALMAYKPSLINVIQQWGEKKDADNKIVFIESVKKVLAKREPITFGDTHPEKPPPMTVGAVYIPPKEPPQVKPTIEGPQFVWVKGAKGPRAEVWHDGNQHESEMPIQPLQRHQMTGPDTDRTIAELMLIYPFKGK